MVTFFSERVSFSVKIAHKRVIYWPLRSLYRREKIFGILGHLDIYLICLDGGNFDSKSFVKIPRWAIGR